MDLTLFHTFSGDTKGDREEDSLTDWMMAIPIRLKKTPSMNRWFTDGNFYERP